MMLQERTNQGRRGVGGAWLLTSGRPLRQRGQRSRLVEEEGLGRIGPVDIQMFDSLVKHTRATFNL